MQLRSRHWRITDADGRTEEVRGPGVVGETPVLKPGTIFRYTSGCPLDTPSGIMVGTYQMTTETGELFNVADPRLLARQPARQAQPQLKADRRTMSASVSTAKELLARLVAFDTTSHKTNIPLIDFVEDYLAGHGIESQRVPTADGLKASLFATIGPQRCGGIALSGHTDVVPVAGQAWDTDPFTLVERDGKLYGRGTCDMKGYLACALAMVPDFKARKLKVPIHLAFSYDEEVGCTGVRPMIAELGKTLPLPRMVFVGEPTKMGVVDAHKGPVRWRVELTGRAAHSSMPHYGVNAIAYAGRLIGELAAHGGGAQGLDPQPALRSAVDDDAGDADRGRHGLQRRAGALLVRLGDAGAAGLRSDDAGPAAEAFAAETCLPEMRRVAPEADIKITPPTTCRPTPPTPSPASCR